MSFSKVFTYKMEYIIQHLNSKEPKHIFLLLESLDHVLNVCTQRLHSFTSDLIDIEILEEIKNIIAFGKTGVFFGKTLRDIKIILEDDELRKHELYLQYKGPKKLFISAVELPHSSMQNREYTCLQHIISAFKQNVCELARYFCELENIDQLCTVMEPVNKSFKYDYRRIFLDERTWLHIEVTPEGLATNVHLVGQSEYWHNKLQLGLLNWDHDKNIVDNIMIIFDFTQFPQPATVISEQLQMYTEDKTLDGSVVCGICLCTDLPDSPGLPLPLCQNSTCGVYYHRNCLYQWLVACAGSRPPAFGVANGSCPTCLKPIACNEKDS